MKNICGTQVATTLSEIIEPRSCAVLVVDVQKDYCLDDRGRETYPEMLGALGRLLESARQSNVLPIYIQDTLLPNRESDSPGWIRHYMIGKKKTYIPKETALKGSPGQEFVDKIAPRPQDTIIQKFRSSAFYGTPLDLILRSKAVKTVIVTGVVTYGCVESTCRDALNEYYVVVPEDCIAAPNYELHEACLKIMRSRYDVCMSDNIITQWGQKLVEIT